MESCLSKHIYKVLTAWGEPARRPFEFSFFFKLFPSTTALRIIFKFFVNISQEPTEAED